MSVLSHMTFGTNDPARSKKFYDATLATLGMARQVDGQAYAAYGRDGEGEFLLWVLPPHDGLPATWGNGAHIAFLAPSRAVVQAFHKAALAQGGLDDGPPSLRVDYSPGYYAAYVRDPDGNKLQAVTFRSEGEDEPYAELVSHITLGVNDLARAKAFYDVITAPLGLVRVVDEDIAYGYGLKGTKFPWVYAHKTFDGRPATCGNGTHVAFLAPSRAAVDGFHAAGLGAGGRDEGAPGLRPDYGDSYYGAYLRDPDGNKLQAVSYQPA